MKTRRGLSSVVGMVFAIIAMATTIAYVTHSLDVLEKFTDSILTRNQQTVDIGKENFKISGATINKNKFNITVTNTGNLPINFTKMWVQNSSATDWVRSYAPVNNFVGPGATLNNIGQNIPLSALASQTYHIKLVTSRGNSQEFNVNSANSAPLNIQFYAFPSTVSSGFTTQLVMIVTNNSTSTLVNVAPSTPTLQAGSDAQQCGPPGSVIPPSYSTLPPGGTAVFMWPLTVSGSADQFCTYRAQLQNGYTGNFAETKVTVTLVTLSSTTYAQNAGVLTIDYASFRWAQTIQWKSGWQFTNGKTAFSLTLVNNNQTAGNYKFWISENSQLFFQVAGGTSAPTSFYVVNTVDLNQNGATVTAYTPDFNKNVPNQGGSTTIYFGSKDRGSTSPQGGQIQTLSAGTYTGFIVLYGKFAVNQGDTGSEYAQTIPFVAVIST